MKCMDQSANSLICTEWRQVGSFWQRRLSERMPKGVNTLFTMMAHMHGRGLASECCARGESYPKLIIGRRMTFAHPFSAASRLAPVR